MQKALTEYIQARIAKDFAEAEAKHASAEFRKAEQALCTVMEEQDIDSVDRGGCKFRSRVSPKFRVNKKDYAEFKIMLEEIGARDEDYFEESAKAKAVTTLGKTLLADGSEIPDIMNLFMQKSISVRGWAAMEENRNDE